jgi:dTDP-4-amino-4,6-dideoxygalactose transaminase
MWRRQLPAYSPLPLGAVIAGAAGLLSSDTPARAAVTARLAAELGASEVLLTETGTGALTLAIRSCLAQTPGAPVAMPAYSCYDLATAADGAGVPVLLYDVDAASLAPEPASLRRALEGGARAVVVAHLFGIPIQPEPIRAVTTEAGAWLIEDAAQGAGASWKGRPLGSFGDLAVLSFGRGKGNTAGRGGALLARDTRASDPFARARMELQPSARGVKELVQLKAQWLLGRPSLYAIPASLPFLHLGETVYHRPTPVRQMSAVAARALAVTGPLGEGEAATRRAHAARLLARNGRGLTPLCVPSRGEAGYLRLPLLASPEARAVAVSDDARRLGIMSGYPQALCDLAGFRDRVLNRGDSFTGARQLAKRLITLPTHSQLEEADLLGLESWLARL